MPPVNPQVTPSHETARVAQKEDGGAAVLGRLAQAAQHVLLRPLGAALGELDEEGLDHVRDDVARGDGVDADAVGAPLCC